MRLERVLTLNHSVLLDELSSLRQSLVGVFNIRQSGDHRPLEKANNSPTNRDEHQNNISPMSNTSLPIESLNFDSGGNTSSGISVRIDKWNICYDGSQDVNDFLFKVKTLKIVLNILRSTSFQSGFGFI